MVESILTVMLTECYSPCDDKLNKFTAIVMIRLRSEGSTITFSNVFESLISYFYVSL